MISTECAPLREGDYQMLKGFWNQERKSSFGKHCVSFCVPIQPVIQNGPMCGIVALCMAGQMLGGPLQDPSVVLNMARNCGITHRGEMFSAFNLATLSETVYDCRAIVDQFTKDSCAATLQCIVQGFPVLVPYDSDRNHGPCFQKGHAAHWALLNGFCLVVDEVPAGLIPDTNDHSLHYLHYHSKYLPELLTFLLKKNPKIFVCGMQGKSQYFGVWSWDELNKSNGQLSELNPKHMCHNFILPEGGVKVGLRGSIVKLFPNK